MVNGTEKPFGIMPILLGVCLIVIAVLGWKVHSLEQIKAPAGTFSAYGLPGLYLITPNVLTDGQGQAPLIDSRGRIILSQ